MEKQISLFPEKRTSVSNREKRNVVLTTERIRWYEFALESAIREEVKRIKDKNMSEGTREVYLNIIKRYEAELDYLNRITWEGEDVSGA